MPSAADPGVVVIGQLEPVAERKSPTTPRD
jgi:hypothetical protein